MSKARLLVKESVRIQAELNSQLEITNFSRTSALVADGRSPLSGISDPLPNYNGSEDKLREIETKEALRQPNRLNSRILEAWINNTINDAEQIEMPNEIVASESRQPLIRYGVDRQSLISAGVTNSQVDRIFRALFVYSIGFYQLINKAMEHCAKKNVLTASIWKVYSILLEYCCHKDYRMVVSTLMQQHEQEVAKVEQDYRMQLELLALNEVHLVTNLEDIREQLNEAQGNLALETHRREELEDELQQRGSGHEKEVELRLKFESKLNQMFAQQRDLEVRLDQQIQLLKATQVHLEEKHMIIDIANKKILALQVVKQEQEISISNLERLLAQQHLAIKSSEQKNLDIEKRTEVLNEMLAKARENQQNTLADAISKNLTIERLQSERTTAQGTLSRVKIELEEQNAACVIVGRKNSKLEGLLAAQAQQVQELEALLVVNVSAMEAKEKELDIVRDQLVEVTKQHKVNQDKILHLSQELDTKLLIVDELSKQLKHLLTGVEEATKGRKVAEERTKLLERRQTELVTDLEATEKALLAERHECDRFSTRVRELEVELEFADSKFQSSEKMTNSHNEALLAKIKSLTQISVSEKHTRDMWVDKFEKEQKAHNEAVKEVLGLKQATKDLELMSSDFSVKLHQANLAVQTEHLHAQQLLEANYVLKSEVDELQRSLDAQKEFSKLNESNFSRKVGELETYVSEQQSLIEGRLLASRMQLADAESSQLLLWHRLSSEETTAQQLRTELAQLKREKLAVDLALESTIALDARGRMQIEELLMQLWSLSGAHCEVVRLRTSTDKLLARTQAELQMYKNVNAT